MPTKTITVWSHESKSKKSSVYFSKSISDINSVINSNLPDSSYLISKVIMKVYANYDGGTSIAKVYIRYGFGPSGGISTELQGDNRISLDSGSCYPSSGVDITGYFSKKYIPCAISSDYGACLSVEFHTANIAVSKYHLDSVDLEITYYEDTRIKAVAQPTEGGKVEVSGGLIGHKNTALYAYPNTGYKFIGWYDAKGTFLSDDASFVFEPADPYGTYTGVFQLEKINKILIDTAKPSKILIDNQEVKAIYVDTTKVYG